MHQRPLKPHTVVLRIVSSDTYEELWNGASRAEALIFVKSYLRATRDISHEQLRVVIYLGNNLWQSNKVGYFKFENAEPYQPNLF